MRKINILGTNYEIVTQSENENLKLKDANGLCEIYSKKIVLAEYEDDPMMYENFDEFKKRVLRHEVIHAFFAESGLRSSSAYAENEELVDWIANQSPKLFKAFQELDAL